MDEYTLTALFMVVVGSLPCAVFGYLIAVKQKRDLISGWDESKVRDPESFGLMVGWSLVVMSVLLAGVAAAWANKALSETDFVVGLMAVSLVPIFALLLAKAKYGL